jgi:N-acyl-D-amino-acid deacylase
MHDLVIRSGTVVDGSGGPRFSADVAIDGGLISAVGPKLGEAKREIDASGLLVTPGWVDVHTHYDGQVTWDPYLSSSCWHGVTTVVMGNCGVGFAPVRPGQEEALITIMEGVEDIPGSALSEGIAWNWEGFPEYLNALSAIPLAMDVATQVPHAAVRAYVMGDRGARNEVATAEDLREMSNLVHEAVDAGALGFSTSRIDGHRSADGSVVPGSFVASEEMLAFSSALQQAGGGVLEIASDIQFGLPIDWTDDEEFDWIERAGNTPGVTASMIVVQSQTEPTKWRSILARIEKARAGGADIVAQVAPRAIGLFFSWESTFHPFMGRPSFDEVAGLPSRERLTRLKDPELRRRILAETSDKTAFENFPKPSYATMFRLQDPNGELNYEPHPDNSVESLAKRTGKAPDAIVYDIMMENEGLGFVWDAFLNYTDRNLDHVYELLQNDACMVSLSDAGAHCGSICDVSAPTFLLTFWARDRSRGPRLSVEAVVAMQARDRGLIAPGMKADLNLIDHDALQLLPPEMVYDLPAGGRRLIQKATGYRATVVSGVVTFENGEATGELPGRLVRGSRDN